MHVAVFALVVVCQVPVSALAEVRCQNTWVTFPGTVVDDLTHYSDRRKQNITIRKADVQSLMVLFSDQGLAPTALVYVNEREAPYEVDTVDYYDVVACLD